MTQEKYRDRQHRSIKDVCAGDPVGSQFVRLAAAADHCFGRNHYITDGLDDPENYDPVRLHPSFTLTENLANPAGLHHALVDYENGLGDSEREQALRMKVRGLRMMTESLTGTNHYQMADIVVACYGFDPRDLPRAEEDDVRAHSQQILSLLPVNLRPSTGIDDSEKLAAAWVAFINEFRVPEANRSNASRKGYMRNSDGIVRTRLSALGIEPGKAALVADYPATSGLEAYMRFYPGRSRLTQYFYEAQDLQPLPHTNLGSVAHELGHRLHLGLMRDQAIATGHTEGMIYPAFGPHAVSEGIADGLAYLAFPTAEIKYEAAVELYRRAGAKVDQSALKDLLEAAMDPLVYRPGFLGRRTRILWTLYQQYETNVAEHGVPEADRLFIESYSRRLLQSERSAWKHLTGFKYLGPYAYVYDYYRALVISDLQQPGGNQQGRMTDWCYRQPINVPSPAALNGRKL